MKTRRRLPFTGTDVKDVRLTDAGKPDPLGVTLDKDGINVAVFSAHAETVTLCLFGKRGGRETRIPLQRSGDVFHGRIAGIPAGTRYGFRASGPYDPAAGHRFDAAKLLVDPYALALDRPYAWHGELALPPGRAVDTAPLVPKGIVLATPPVLKTTRPSIKPEARVIYEVNTRAFTKSNPQVPRALRGTLAGLAHPASLAHIVRLGVTTLELMPIAAWIDERHLPPLGLANAWGYNPVGFFALDPRLAPGGIADLRHLVATFHEAGIEVILDIVFNHTGESDEFGGTLSLRGLDNATYYRLDPSDPARYVNDTGTGNTLALDRPAPMRLALDALRYFATIGGVDGYRFDLAPVLGRCDDGFRPDAPLLSAIGRDPVLKDLLLIAEPWDIGHGGYRLGEFPESWSEWNDRYRDDVRRFWRGDDGAIGSLATRLAGSADLFEASGRPPSASINFVAAHDGFTLADLVAYADKHNEANGEGNRDGAAFNFSWNSGAEGPAGAAIAAARLTDIRALLATLFLSRGTPMLTAGDELGRSQGGNNNAYAQDNEHTWLDWKNADEGLIDTVAALIAFRRDHPVIAADRFLTGQPAAAGVPDVAWLDEAGEPLTTSTWDDPGRRVLGMALCAGRERILVWFNAGFEPVKVALPVARPGHVWRAIDIDPTRATHLDQARGASLAARSVTIFSEA
ncbi:MAG: glycogen debranching protein GlgX [Bauldia sp.]